MGGGRLPLSDAAQTRGSMMRKSVLITGAVALLGFTACGDQLNVANVTNPDVERVLSSAKGIEATISGFGSQLNNPQRASESVNTQSKIMAEETFATVANFGMAARVASRFPINNELGNDHALSNITVYNSLQRLSRSVANALAAFNRVKAAGLNTLTPADENRMLAFAYLILGQTQGYVAFAYDSGAIVTAAVASGEIPGLSSAAALNAAAIANLDSAVIIAGRGMTTAPNTWISGVALDQAAFIRLARSYRARIRAGVARTELARRAVAWPLVIADAAAGITADHNITVGGTTGWAFGFDAGQMYVTGGWHAFPMAFAGMADSSGAYQTWFNTVPTSSRRAFLVLTADQRWATGGTRAAQQASTPTNSIAPRYIRNRPTGEDVVAASSGESFYDHRRYGATNVSTTGGPYTDMSKTEIDMLAAEGHLYAGNRALAEPLISISRVRNGLPSVVGVGAGVVPGGNACVPKLRSGACGTLLDALKYEKRMETAFTGFMVWFTDSRGWGDLPTNTAVEWPVPYQEMQARQQAYYNGTNTFRGSSTYGF